MEEKKIFVVISFGGEWEEKYEKVECAFTSKEAADKYIKENTKLHDKISDDDYYKIQEFVAPIEYDIQCKYYDPTTGELYEGKTDDEWNKEYDSFEKEGKYKLIEEKFGFTKEDVERKETDIMYDFVGYTCNEINLYD